MSVLPQTLYAGVTSGTPVPIIAKTWARGVTIREDASGVAAGLIVTFPNGKTIEINPGMEPLVIGQVPASNGPFVGMPASSVGGGGNAATIYCTVQSIAATTVVQVIEYS
jgi:hypothetical protein